MQLNLQEAQEIKEEWLAGSPQTVQQDLVAPREIIEGSVGDLVYRFFRYSTHKSVIAAGSEVVVLSKERVLDVLFD